MVNGEDRDFYNTYRLLGGGFAQFGEIFHGYSPQEVRHLEQGYRQDEEHLKIVHKTWWESRQPEEAHRIREVVSCSG